jgi:hypothetical protein
VAGEQLSLLVEPTSTPGVRDTSAEYSNDGFPGIDEPCRCGGSDADCGWPFCLGRPSLEQDLRRQVRRAAGLDELDGGVQVDRGGA